MKNVFTIDSTLPFAQTLARFLLSQNKENPLSLAKTVIFLPTVRSCKTMREAFLQESDGAPLLLPRFMSLSALDSSDSEASFFLLNEGIEIPPALPPLRRRLLLSRLIQKRYEEPLSMEKALSLADSLANLLDEGYRERVDFSRLQDLVPEDFASHWQETLTFLEIITKAWPELLASQGVIDKADRQIRLLKAQADFWKKTLPDYPVFAAGLTGTQPAVSELLDTIASLKTGSVILEGVDMQLDEESFSRCSEEPTHPQYEIKILLDTMQITRQEIRYLDGQEGDKQRASLISEVMRPASTTDLWRKENIHKEVQQKELDGIEEIACATKQEEALTIALILRQALETKGKTAALVTPDRELARRVVTQMTRWGILLDDSAGTSLALTPVGAFLNLLAQASFHNWKAIDLLACLKHPLALGGKDFVSFRTLVRELERSCLRGVSLEEGLLGIKKQAEKSDEKNETDRLSSFVSEIIESVSEFTNLMLSSETHTLEVFLHAHLKAAETLANSHDRTGAERLWNKEEGDVSSTLFTQLCEEASVLGEISAFDYIALFSSLLRSTTVRPKYGMHPRLDVLGAIEARLIQADVIVLGGLNEGVWPQAIKSDAWLSRPMREKIGLSSPERKIAPLAHDFAQAFCSKNVILTRSLKEGGAPTVPSRWLLRLKTVLEIEQLSIKKSTASQWAEKLDKPEVNVSFMPPEPKPPISARPTKFSVTGLERLMRDPYAFYAGKILKLSPTDEFIEGITFADFGTVVHSTLEEFVSTYKTTLPLNPKEEMKRISEKYLQNLNLSEMDLLFLTSQLNATFEWFLETHKERLPLIKKSLCEQWFEMNFKTEQREYTLGAKADRIDILKDNEISLIDYKTGSLPTEKQVQVGFAPQLPLEAKILMENGLEGVNASFEVSSLEYWKVKGKDNGAFVREIKKELPELVDKYFYNFKTLLGAYEKEETGYPAQPNKSYALSYNDFEHLGRYKEWASFDSAEEEEEE